MKFLDAIDQVEWDVPRELNALKLLFMKVRLNSQLFINDALEIRSCAPYM